MENIILIDAYSQIFRCYYAVKSAMSNSRGEPTNALYGMARLLMTLDKTQPSTYGAVCFDLGHCTWRCELLPEYKAQRSPMPDELRAQVEPIRCWLQAFGWTLIEEEGREADDLIAAITAVRDGRNVRIITQDKDLAQLVVGDEVRLMTSASGGSWEETAPDDVVEKFGVPPELLGDYLALVGDHVDNIQGIVGVGPKTAARLLVEHGSLAGLLAAVDSLKPGRVQTNLKAGGEQLQRNRRLVGLDETLPRQWQGLAGIRRQRPDWRRLLDMARDQGFKSLVPAIEKAIASERGEQLTLF